MIAVNLLIPGKSELSKGNKIKNFKAPKVEN